MRRCWYRLYQGLPADPEFSVIARRAKITRAEALAIWLTVLDAACHAVPRGSVAGLDAETISALLDIQADKVAQALRALSDRKMVTKENMVANWAKHQNVSTPRVHALRTRQKKAVSKPVPPQNTLRTFLPQR